ncbi:MAG: hypothetical protein QOI53_4065 [Verrucomicrobiota bacterium]|nr:hypothetical protein [Verrucomicrobiota bacterium]
MKLREDGEASEVGHNSVPWVKQVRERYNEPRTTQGPDGRFSQNEMNNPQSAEPISAYYLQKRTLRNSKEVVPLGFGASERNWMLPCFMTNETHEDSNPEVPIR